MSITGTLTTAVAVDDETAARIIARVERLSGENCASWSRTVDSSIIGGFKARIGDHVYDMSISSQLDIIKKKLSE